MYIKKLIIENFKGFNGKFSLELNSGTNVIVGDNEAGKSTILEAINIALKGLYHGRYIKNELSQYLFNETIVREYINSVKIGKPIDLPKILIELYFDSGDETPLFQGSINSLREDCSGVRVVIEFNEHEYKDAYENFLKTSDIDTLPIEYYHIVWVAFSSSPVTIRNMPLKSALIDSSSSRYQNGSDIYISQIIKELLTQEEVVNISQLILAKILDSTHLYDFVV